MSFGSPAPEELVREGRGGGNHDPDGDHYLTLDARVRLANQRGAAIFVSIHNDANLNRQIRGTTTYYYNAVSRPLAASVQRELVRALGSNDIGIRQAPF